MKQIWSSGGGTQSTAIAILILQRRLPLPDYSVIADTGREKQSTWDYLEAVVNPALRKSFGREIIKLPCIQAPPVFNAAGTLLLPVYATGAAKFSNFCSSYWKRDKVKQWAVSQGLLPATNWLGISVDEIGRVRTPRANNWLLEYPLIDAVPMRRRDCVELISSYGWPKAPRSACWMCPNMSNQEWRALREDSPTEFSQAVQLERQMRTVKPDVFLHRSLRQLDEAPLEDDDLQGTFGCDSGDCFV